MSSQAAEKVSVDQLQVGVYIQLQEVWYMHPFLRSSFLIKKEKQIQALRDSGIKEVLYVPEKSQRPCLPARKKKPAEPLQNEQEKDTSPDENISGQVWETKQRRIKQFSNIQERIKKCSRQYKNTVQKMPSMLNDIFAGREEGMQNAQEVVSEMAQTFLSETTAVMHLMDAEEADMDLAYHFLNVSVLSMMIGEAAQLQEEDMKHLGMGALLHDLGKLRIEKKHLRKPREMLSKHELKLLKMHPQYGVETLCAIKTGPPQPVKEIVRHHHEALSGIGYPQGLKADRISYLTRITTLANIFDNLCNPYNPEQAMSPHHALSFIYRRYDLILDMHLVSLLVKRLGVYPPGCIVELSTKEVAKVMAVDPAKPLRPLILLYDPDVPRKHAAVFNMDEDRDLFIDRCLNPEELSQEAARYLKPRQKVAYYAEEVPEK
ncbi:metal dependent phosphohydrolase [Desulfonatronospira thiodismutans ASO3-1]|uniref:Metal dependent phosphohydrolase n=1 Tax=Desulfonatronospira thiodismutans ASO3-1 TaxID=555779 RepID=D6SSH9_9BACT|nr:MULTISPECIES: HD-GYP domain-containing protein [Desulfonatronospira]EFI33645.1 metal dependent phosphohydrolase [Desulfonatronospira thiodismutans ASO3-1]RQD76994.1 MAG: HD-GYP domain-containing protein [Desulfonatronospira sp. MSAO_Bac3]